MPARAVQIHNAHPRLRFPRAAVKRVIRVLDEQFTLLPGDLPHLSLPRPRLRALASTVTNSKTKNTSPVPPGELALVFLTDPAIAKIHADFMADPTATDVITFEGNSTGPVPTPPPAPETGDPGEEIELEAGEICISVDTAANYAREHGRDFATELTLYVVHGWLHLAGYDDLEPAKKRRMRAAEKRALALLTAASAIPPFALRAPRKA